MRQSHHVMRQSHHVMRQNSPVMLRVVAASRSHRTGQWHDCSSRSLDSARQSRNPATSGLNRSAVKGRIAFFAKILLICSRSPLSLPAFFCMAVIIYRALLKTVKETDLLCLHLFGALISPLPMATRHVEAHLQRIRKAKNPDSTMLRSLLERLVRFFMVCRGESA